MSKLFATAVLAASIYIPAYADAPASIVPTVATGAMALVQTTGVRPAADSGYTPSEDCCYDEVNLDRPMPAPRVERGPSCCWDASSWD
jgi:hypothetical protein